MDNLFPPPPTELASTGNGTARLLHTPRVRLHVSTVTFAFQATIFLLWAGFAAAIYGHQEPRSTSDAFLVAAVFCWSLLMVVHTGSFLSARNYWFYQHNVAVRSGDLPEELWRKVLRKSGISFLAKIESLDPERTREKLHDEFVKRLSEAKFDDSMAPLLAQGIFTKIVRTINMDYLMKLDVVAEMNKNDETHTLSFKDVFDDGKSTEPEVKTRVVSQVIEELASVAAKEKGMDMPDGTHQKYPNGTTAELEKMLLQYATLSREDLILDYKEWLQETVKEAQVILRRNPKDEAALEVMAAIHVIPALPPPHAEVSGISGIPDGSHAPARIRWPSAATGAVVLHRQRDDDNSEIECLLPSAALPKNDPGSQQNNGDPTKLKKDLSRIRKYSKHMLLQVSLGLRHIWEQDRPISADIKEVFQARATYMMCTRVNMILSALLCGLSLAPVMELHVKQRLDVARSTLPFDAARGQNARAVIDALDENATKRDDVMYPFCLAFASFVMCTFSLVRLFWLFSSGNYTETLLSRQLDDNGQFRVFTEVVQSRDPVAPGLRETVSINMRKQRHLDLLAEIGDRLASNDQVDTSLARFGEKLREFNQKNDATLQAQNNMGRGVDDLTGTMFSEAMRKTRTRCVQYSVVQGLMCFNVLCVFLAIFLYDGSSDARKQYARLADQYGFNTTSPEALEAFDNSFDEVRVAGKKYLHDSLRTFASTAVVAQLIRSTVWILRMYGGKKSIYQNYSAPGLGLFNMHEYGSNYGRRIAFVNFDLVAWLCVVIPLSAAYAVCFGAEILHLAKIEAAEIFVSAFTTEWVVLLCIGGACHGIAWGMMMFLENGRGIDGKWIDLIIANSKAVTDPRISKGWGYNMQMHAEMLGWRGDKNAMRDGQALQAGDPDRSSATLNQGIGIHGGLSVPVAVPRAWRDEMERRDESRWSVL